MYIKDSSETLLDIAYNDLDDARILLDDYNVRHIERKINSAGYSLQQALEKILKHYIAINGDKVAKVHSIVQLLMHCKDYNIELPISSEHIAALKMYSADIENMESDARYVKGGRLSVSEVMAIFDLVKDIFNDIGYTPRAEYKTDHNINRLQLDRS